MRRTLLALACFATFGLAAPALAAPQADRVETTRPSPKSTAGQKKVLSKVTADEAFALFRSLEHTDKTTRHRQAVDGSKALVGKVRYTAGATQKNADGRMFLGVRMDSTYQVMGNKFRWTKNFLFEWNPKTGKLTAEIDQPRVSSGEFNVKLKTRSGKATAMLKLAGRAGEVGADGTTKTVYLKNIPFDAYPHIYLNREGAGNMIRIWAGMQFHSKLSKEGVAVPGSKKDINVDVKAKPTQIGLGGGVQNTRFTDKASVDVDGAIYTGFTYEQKFVREKVSRMDKLKSRIKMVPSAVNLDVRPRFRYQVSTGSLVAQGSAMSYKQRYFPLRAVPKHSARDARLSQARKTRTKAKKKTARARTRGR